MTPDLDGLTLYARRAVLLVIDVQERLAAAMPEPVRTQLQHNLIILLEAARRLAIPVVASEQYPKGLGVTMPRVASALDALGPVHRIEKLEFSVCDNEEFSPIAWQLSASGRDEWIVTGMECHVCVWQSVRGLRGRGAKVHVVADAVASRTKPSWRAGLGLAERAGAVITTTEAVVFDLLGRAGTDDFKALSKLIK
jgi:nicotinamidase-related amidase